MKIIMKESKNDLKTLFIRLIKAAGELVRSKDIAKNS